LLAREGAQSVTAEFPADSSIPLDLTPLFDGTYAAAFLTRYDGLARAQEFISLKSGLPTGPDGINVIDLGETSGINGLGIWMDQTALAVEDLNIAAALILIARITPGLSYLIPLFLLFQWLGMTGTLTPIVITHLVITVPIVVWVMISFFEGLPPELEEAALVDGATIWQAFRYVAMPLARPGITVATILSFIFSWNNFIFAMVLAGRETRTLPVAVNNMLTFEQVAWGPLSAAALLVTAPVLILTLVAQKQIVAGLTAGGVKGA
jgi:ABC-type sugar transport system permease subunit